MVSTLAASYISELGVLGKKKIELQTNGIKVPQELIDDLEKNWNAPAIRRGRFVICLESPDDNKLTTVLIINGNFAAKSPFHMVKNGSNYEIWENNKKYTDIVLLPRPEFYDSYTSDGVPMSEVAVIGEPDHLRSVLNQKCAHHLNGKSCKFCAIENWWAGHPNKTPTQIAETAEAAYKEGLIRHITLSTGTKASQAKGLEDIVETAKLIRKRASCTMTLNFEPMTDYALLESLLKEAKQAGATTALCNIECFDPNLREEVMPIKGKLPITVYANVWEKCLDIFGRNEVYTMIIAGLGESDDSILKGVEFAASHGVVASIVPHTPMIGAVYQDMQPPRTERMLYLFEAALPIYEEYDLKLYGGTGGIYTSLKGM
jgi:biotin synthase-related radical SAM superfamily protein